MNVVPHRSNGLCRTVRPRVWRSAAAFTVVLGMVTWAQPAAAVGCYPLQVGDHRVLYPSLRDEVGAFSWMAHTGTLGQFWTAPERSTETSADAWVSWRTGCIAAHVSVEVATTSLGNAAQVQYDVYIGGRLRGSGWLSHAAHSDEWVQVWTGRAYGDVQVVVRDDRTVEATDRLRFVTVGKVRLVGVSPADIGGPFAEAHQPDGTYPEAGHCDNVGDLWNMVRGQCTSNAAWRLNEAGIPFHNRAFDGASMPGLNGNRLLSLCDIDPALEKCDYHRKWGHAKYWAAQARHIGLRVDTTPAPGAVMVVTQGKYGHVMYVETTETTNRIAISDMNRHDSCGLRERHTVERNGDWEWMDSHTVFIHFEDLLWPRDLPGWIIDILEWFQGH